MSVVVDGAQKAVTQEKQKSRKLKLADALEEDSKGSASSLMDGIGKGLKKISAAGIRKQHG